MIRKIDNADEAIEVYGRFRNQILDTLERDPDTSEIDILRLLDNREAVMFVSDNSIAIVQIITYEGETYCLIRIAAGDLSEILDGEDFVTEWSKKWNAIGIILKGRKGWKRVLETRGYFEIQVNNNNIENNTNEKAGLYLLGKYYNGINSEDYDANNTD